VTPINDISGEDTKAGETPMNLSIERAANMLGLFSVDRPELTLAELTDGLGSSKATTHRYALALRRTGLLRWNAETLRYAVGARIIELASVAMASLPVLDIAVPHMERLSAEFDQTLVLSIWDGDEPLILRVVDKTDRLVTINVRPGGRMRREASAQGRLFVAFTSTNDRDGSPLPEGILNRIRETHVSVFTSEGAGFRAVAAPIFQGGKVAATLGVVGLINAVPDEDTSDLATALKGAAEVISGALAYTPQD
jgi:IclR family pca regulon transcriptional regulator